MICHVNYNVIVYVPFVLGKIIHIAVFITKQGALCVASAASALRN